MYKVSGFGIEGLEFSGGEVGLGGGFQGLGGFGI